MDAGPGFVSRGTLEIDEWRSVILFGQNVASYKFALGRSLIDLAKQERQVVPLEDLAEPFSAHLVEHITRVDTQGTSPSSAFLDACRYFNEGRISRDELLTVTVDRGFNNVIDAFHHVGGSDVSTRFFEDERRGSTRGIRITDETLELVRSEAGLNLEEEVEARWSLVEHAWHARKEGEPVRVLYDAPREILVRGLRGKRRSITDVRPALNGYQKGFCFYCFRPILVVPNSPEPADVDHLIPHSLMARGLPVDLDQVWNLVLACATCNRGEGGKFDLLPSKEYLEQLWTRNEYLIWSHHPLRDTLVAFTGDTSHARRNFMTEAWISAEPLAKGGGWRPANP